MAQATNELSYPSPQTLTAPSHIYPLLARLHAQSLAEEQDLKQTWTEIRSKAKSSTDNDNQPSSYSNLLNTTMSTKMVALDADKAAFIYNLIRSKGATRIVELGTSVGVSTVYLALAVGQNLRALTGGSLTGSAGVVATEWEAAKAERARMLWKEAGVEEVEKWIELRQGDLKETLKEPGIEDGSVEVVLFDVWTPLVVPALEILEPKLKPGAVLFADNTVQGADGYVDFFSKVRASGSPYRSVTLPFNGGLEMVTYCPRD